MLSIKRDLKLFMFILKLGMVMPKLNGTKYLTKGKYTMCKFWRAKWPAKNYDWGGVIGKFPARERYTTLALRIGYEY